MSLGKNTHRLGGLTKDNIDFPKHLTPEIIHTAQFIYNAPTKEETKIRVEYCAKQIGDEAMSYAMSLLVLPYLMEMTKDTKDYKDFLASKKKTINQTSTTNKGRINSPLVHLIQQRYQTQSQKSRKLKSRFPLNKKGVPLLWVELLDLES